MEKMNKKTCFVVYKLLDGITADRFNNGYIQPAEDLAFELRRYADRVILEHTEGLFYAIEEAALAYISEGVDWLAVADYVMKNTDPADLKEPEPWDESEADSYESSRPEYAQPYMSRW